MFVRTAKIVVAPWVLWAAFFMTDSARAHFIWLSAVAEHDDSPRAILYFSESSSERDYRLPDRIAQADLWQRPIDGARQPLKPQRVESSEWVGLEATLESAPKTPVLEASCQYGIYHGSLLTYFAKHLPDLASQAGQRGRSADFPLDLVAQPTGGRLQVTVLWQGRPLPEAEVVFHVPAGDAIEATTDEAGQVAVDAAEGFWGIRAGYIVTDATGEFGGEPYEGAAYYTTLTLTWPASQSAAPAAGASLPELPEPVASFGAAVHNGWLYVYGGHIGETHAHSRENLSRRFQRLNLQGEAHWQQLPMQTLLQSPALVAHGEYLYRVGGMTARNRSGEEEDLHSVAEFARFDPRNNTWEELTPLPEPRSSHDAVVLDGKLYVIGGWKLEGAGDGTWCDTILVYDLSADNAQWQQLHADPLRRRALAAAIWQGKLVAIGGMTEEREVSQRVDFFDPALGKWSQGPDLPASDMHGFGIAACSNEGALYASGASGIVYRLNDEGTQWVEVASLRQPRFFHRLVPSPAGGLLAIAGAAPGIGHVGSLELVTLGESRD